MHLLYVDDDRINLMLFAATCAGVAGVTVDTAADGDEALQHIARRRPDLIVLDLYLGGTDGFALLDVLRANGLDDQPAFLCSADDDPSVPARAQTAGFAGCWSKPIEPTALRAALGALTTPPAP